MVERSAPPGGPHAFFDLVRAGDPVVHVPELDLWLVAAYEAARQVLEQPELFSSREGKGVNIFASGVEEILHGVEHVGEEFRLVVDRVHDRDTVALQVEVLPPGQ